MASEYHQSSPDSNMLGMSAAASNPAFGGSQSGSDFDFGTPQSLTIDTMMQGNDLTSAATMASYRSAPAGVAGGMGAFGTAFDPALIGQQGGMNGSTQHRGSMSSIQDGTSPMLGHHHRLSSSSNGPFSAQDRDNSFGASDAPSPDGLRGNGGIGDNSLANNSNDTVDSHNNGELMNTKSEEGQAQPPPSWSELKTKAGKERKRLPLACIACRRKKIRCSGEKPACKHCLRSRIPCVYKVTTRKAAPRTDYMAMLDKRLKRMEDRVIKIIPKEEQGVVSNTGRAVVKPPLPAPPPKSAGASKKRVAEAAFGEELDEWAQGRAAEVKTSEGAEDEPETEPLKKQPSQEHSLLQEGADKLPSKEIQEHLAEVFFDFVYCQSYPLLHKPSFMRRLAQGAVPPVLTLAVCAIAARFSTHPEVRTEPAFLRGENWASAARDIALRRYDTPNITILIVYLILGLHEFGTCQGGRSWMFGGMAQRMAYALQLHRDLDHDPGRKDSDEKDGLNFTDREIRRRTMWACFLMDRFNSSGTDRPLFVGEQYIRAQLPIKDSYFLMDITGPTEDLDGNVPNPVQPESGEMADAKENMGVAAYLIRLVSVWGKLVAYLNLGGKDKDKQPMWSEQSKFHEIKQHLKAWRDSLPETMVYTPENLQNHASEKLANQFIFLHIVYQQSILFMNRFALPIPGSRPSFPDDMPSDFKQEASRAAHDAANQISNLVNEGMDHHVVAPFAGYAAFFSSTVHIYGAFSKSSTLEQSSKQKLAWNVKYLTKMKKYWGMFHFVTENLRDLYRRHADAARSGSSKGKEGEQTIFQYGDWFDRYPHGVSGTDYEEPSAEIKREPGADAVLGQKSDLQSVEEFFSKLSPPSRAVAEASQGQGGKQTAQHRKVAKRRHEKTASKVSNVSATPTTQQQQLQQQAPTSDISAMQDASTLGEGSDMLTAQMYHGMPGLTHPHAPHPHSQHSTAFPPGYQQPPNPLLLDPPHQQQQQQQQQIMSQLDRQMVLNSYAGIPAPTNPFPTTSLLDPTTTALDAFDFPNNLDTSPNNRMANGGGNLWGDPSAAWFMPFNLDPPSLSEDGNWFGNGQGFNEWGGFGVGMGDFGVGGTGLTPRPEMEIEGQEVGGGGGGGGQEGM